MESVGGDGHYNQDDDVNTDDATTIYTIQIQTDPTQTFNSGFSTFQVSQTDEHIAGMICLSACLFGPQINSHLRIFMNGSGQGWDDQSQLGQINPATMINEHFICVAPFLIEKSPQISWYEYIQILASAAPTHPLPNPIQMRYNCRFKTPISTSIVQFDHRDFLEGAIKLCQWLDYSYTDFIDLVHLDDVPMNVVPR